MEIMILILAIIAFVILVINVYQLVYPPKFNCPENKCPVCPTVSKPKLEVFQTNDKTLFKDASKKCAQYDSLVATEEQLKQAQAGGADWITPGWVSDNLTLMYPVTTSENDPGVKYSKSASSPNDTNISANVNCYGVKPPSSTNKNILPFNTFQYSEYSPIN